MGLTEEEIIHVIQELGEKKFRGSQVTQWIYQKRVKSFFEMTNIHKDTRQRFDEHFLIDWPEIIEIQKSSLDHTVKFLLKLQDSQNIETVLMEDEEPRKPLPFKIWEIPVVFKEETEEKSDSE